MQLVISAIGIKENQNRFIRIVRGAPGGVRKANRQFMPKLLTSLVHHASGRPGPQIVTGQYVGNMRVEDGGDRGYTIVGYNPSPQSARLEGGFVGVDDLGRHFAQPPFPHFRPAAQEVFPQYTEAMGIAVKEMIL